MGRGRCCWRRPARSREFWILRMMWTAPAGSFCICREEDRCIPPRTRRWIRICTWCIRKGRGFQVCGAADGGGGGAPAGAQRIYQRGLETGGAAPGEFAHYSRDAGAAGSCGREGDGEYRPVREYDRGDDSPGIAGCGGAGAVAEGRFGAVDGGGCGVYDWWGVAALGVLTVEKSGWCGRLGI